MTAETPTAEPSASFIKRLLLRLMLVFVAVGVVVAIVAVLRGEPLGETLSKVLTTTMGTFLYAALALACADAAEKRPTPYAVFGIGAACVAVAVVFVGVWFEQARFPWWWKAMSISTVYALAFWRGARLSLTELPGFGALIVRVTTFACVAIATLITMMVLRERADPGLVRFMNALWIVAIGGHVAIPILQKLQRP